MSSRDEKFTLFAGDHADGLLRYAYLLTGEQHQTQDVLQESLLTPGTVKSHCSRGLARAQAHFHPTDTKGAL